MRPRVTTSKHYRQDSLFTVAGAGITPLLQAQGVNVTAANASNEVREGAIISAVYLEYWLTSDDTNQATYIATFEKKNSSQPAMTAGDSAGLFSYPNKKNVLITHMGLINPVGGVATPVFREWVKIPKSKQRFGLGDQLVINFHSQSIGLNGCGFTLYKEQY